MRQKNMSLPFISFLQAAATGVYCVGVIEVMTKVDSLVVFSDNPFAAPLIVLMIFVMSALITGSIILGYPIYCIFAEKNVKKALVNIGYIIVWFLVLLVVFLASVLLSNYI